VHAGSKPVGRVFETGNPRAARSVLLIRVGHVMKTRLFDVTRRYALWAFLGVSLLSLGTSWADETDPPGRVARLSDIEGSVSLQPAGVEDWTAPTLKSP